jgi:oligopeptide transport system permease protein
MSDPIPSEYWQPLFKQPDASEKIERPSLTFFEDGWRRLKKNKTALCALSFIIIISFAAVCVPFFWNYTYEHQNLSLSGIPPALDVYRISDTKGIYITPEYSAIEVSHRGDLVQRLEPSARDRTGKKNHYVLDGKALTVDYDMSKTGRVSLIWDGKLMEIKSKILKGVSRYL